MHAEIWARKKTEKSHLEDQKYENTLIIRECNSFRIMSKCRLCYSGQEHYQTAN
jgi:hypothetical protein